MLSCEAPLHVVCLLASAGGLEALTAFFEEVPDTTGASFLVLQHSGAEPPGQRQPLLRRPGALPFRLAQSGDEVRPDQALVLTGGMVLTRDGDRLRVLLPHPVAPSALPGDLLLQSLAETVAERAIGVVLSGDGQDGTAGLRALQAAGGLTLAQEPATAAQEGMPRHAVEAGVVDAALPPAGLAARILEELGRLPGTPQAGEDLQAICALLAAGSGNDFSQYKTGTLGRRVQRRMRALGARDAAAYLAILAGSEAERATLENDLLISVTEFFRDAPAFEALKPHLAGLPGPGDDGPLRLWVPGCATGEEAYSLAILAREALDAANSTRRVQVFGTDLDPAAIVRAKAGRYPAHALRHVDPARLARCFTREGDAWIVSEALRSMCFFSLQNLLHDPPFSCVHLVSCRNVLIYLKPALQARLIPLFHFALRPGGLLFLGLSEGVAAARDLFEPVDKARRIFRRRDVPRPPMTFPVSERRLRVPGAVPGARPEGEAQTRPAALGLFEQMLLTQYLPASAIVDEQGEILYWAGRIGKYLTLVPGQPAPNLCANTSGALNWELRRLLAAAREDSGGGLHAVVSHDAGHGAERLRLTLRPMPGLDREARIYALIIQADAGGDGSQPLPALGETDQPLLEQMNLELQNARTELAHTVETLAATRGERQNATEELQSSNEELQASQEELRSVNEDLFARNSQLTATIQELQEANDDLQNLMASTDIPTLFLDANLAITRFTPTATRLFGLLATDLGRPIRNLLPLFTGMNLPELAREVLRSHERQEAQVRSLEGDRWYLVRCNPYRTLARTVKGVVVSFLDITEIRRTQTLAQEAAIAVRESAAKLEAALASMADAVFISDAEGRFLEFNEAFATFHRFPDKAACARTFAEYPDLMEVFLPDGSLAPVAQWAVPRALRGETAVQQEYGVHRKDTGETWVGSYNLAPLRDEAGRITGSVVTARDITAQKAAERALIESEQRFRTVFDNSPDAVLIRRPEGGYTDVNQVAMDRYGYTREEFRRMTPEDLMPPRLRGQLQALAARALQSGGAIEWVNMKRDGTEFPVEFLLKPFTLNGETFLCASIRDLTDRKRAEGEKAELQEQLQQTYKMESLGRLAGGIAHDMNNVLGAIFAVTRVLQARFSAEQDMEGNLAILEQAAQRGRDLVKGLVGFARKERLAIVTVDVNDLVRRETALLERTLLQKYQLVVDLEEPLPALRGEAGTLGSALMNLCVNAVDAMPDGGTLGIRTRLLEDGAVQLAVEDTGQGMPPEVAKRALEPFFTTKPAGKGTGLGLAMVFNTVRAHGGALAIHSEEGRGTRVVLTFPTLAADPADLEAEGPAPQAASALRILLVDDDELIRSTVPLMLGLLGHQVDAAEGGRQALDHLAEHPLPDLVLLDLNMPDMTGTETLRHLRARYPDLAVLMATGFAEADVEALAGADPNTMVISKPFSFDEIQRKFGELVHRGTATAGVAPPRAALPAAPPAPGPFTDPRAGNAPPSPGNREPLAILLIEDNAIDALVIEGLLKKRNVAFHLRRIETAAALEAALGAGGIDLVLSDFRLPGWDGMAALRRVRAFDPDLPFVFVSGEVDEERFVEAMREGASDFLFKDRLLRLVAVIEREMQVRWGRRRRRGLEAEVPLLHQAIQDSPDWVLLTDLQGAIVYANPALEAASGYPAAELLGRNPRLLKSGRHEAGFYRELWDRLLGGETWRGLITNRRKDGTLWTAHVVISPVRNEQGVATGYACTGRDVDATAR